MAKALKNKCYSCLITVLLSQHIFDPQRTFASAEDVFVVTFGGEGGHREVRLEKEKTGQQESSLETVNNTLGERC